MQNCQNLEKGGASVLKTEQTKASVVEVFASYVTEGTCGAPTLNHLEYFEMSFL